MEEAQTTDALARVAAGNLASAQAGVVVAEAAVRAAEVVLTTGTLSAVVLVPPNAVTNLRAGRGHGLDR